MGRYTHINEGGEQQIVSSHFGPRDFENKLPAEYVSSQGDKVQQITFNFANLPAFSANGVDESVLAIPANSYIVGSTLTTLVPAVGGTSYQIGTSDVEGSNAAATGLFTAATGASLGLVEAGDGTENATTVGANARVVNVAATGTFTAGEFMLEVVYRTLDDRTGSNQS
jgi:hypothetical protein